ncbi:hypothetical protein AGMMS49921_03010 [Endomicrobiia bacterium]|nr:hypothetical protein AGMMS49921_03010 [Endomicrobiia bacterium]
MPIRVDDIFGKMSKKILKEDVNLSVPALVWKCDLYRKSIVYYEEILRRKELEL